MTTAVPSRGLDVSGRRVLVVGLGIMGRDVAAVLASRGASVLGSDANEVDAAHSDALVAAGVDVESGGHGRARAELDSFDLVVPSPGISPLRGFLAEAIGRGAHLVSELDLAVGMTEAPVIAVTGTNGKTTVVRLAALMARQHGLDAHACGNTETPFVTAVDAHPDADLFVVEASSFRLAFCERFSPQVSVITNLAPDHLDWHGTFEHYRDAKARIAARQGPDDLFLYPRNQRELADLAPPDGPRRVAFGPDDLAVPGAGSVLAGRAEHFVADAAAAALAVAGWGIGPDAIDRALHSFEFDPHRLEPVGTKDGIRVVDDSVATNPHATLAALATFDVPVVLIAGGRKKVDIAPLKEASARLRAAVVIGEAADELAAMFEECGVFVSKRPSMREAVAMALETAKPGDVVLLSPACASHDMFSGYAERGRRFQEACRELGVVA